MSNSCGQFVTRNLYSNGFYNGFCKDVIFWVNLTWQYKYLRNNGHNGCYNKPIELKMTHAHLILFNYF